MHEKQISTRVAVVIASLGRPEELRFLLERLLIQTVQPSEIVFSVTKPQDVPENLPAAVKVIMGAAGLCAQRNRGLNAVMDNCDVVAFFDDDYIPARGVLEGIRDLFDDNPDIAGATGTLLADGVCKGGISADDAMRLVDEFDSRETRPAVTITPRDCGAYGCNMAFRCRAIGDFRFDETLPLYGWQEDVDFGVSMGARGRIVDTNAFVGVHCGVAKSRTPGLRMGYSQIANPAYLVRKGTMTVPFAANLIMRNFAANHARALFPEPWMDRKGRAAGNWLAIRDFISGRLHPQRVLEFAPKAKS